MRIDVTPLSVRANSAASVVLPEPEQTPPPIATAGREVWLRARPNLLRPSRSASRFEQRGDSGCEACEQCGEFCFHLPARLKHLLVAQ